MPETTIPVEDFHEFFETYCQEELARLAEHYPDLARIEISHRDIFRWDSDVADDFFTDPKSVTAWFEDAINGMQIGGVSFEDVSVAVGDLPDHAVYSPRELRNEHAGEYIGIRGDLSRVTQPDDFAEVLVWTCQRCGIPTTIPQTSDELQEPHQCSGCERNGPFEINHGESTFVDYSKLRVETPPEDAGTQGSDSIDGYVTGDLVEYGHEDGLVQRAGDRVTVYGEIERTPKGSGQTKKPLFDRRFRVEAIEFDSEQENIDIEAHRETFTEIAGKEDAVERFKQSIAPELFATEAWQAALELGVAYLFGAPRLDIDDGPTYRGDIHALLVTDYGMGKSTFNQGIEAFSPKCINKSATGLSSDVGLLAAAQKDDFGDGQWTIKPGILVRGNGGHVILDEIDKPDAELAKMNDALEGQQTVDVEKAGESATYQSRVGLLATGNPEDSRFDDHDAIAHQIGIDETLLSRFDGIVTMRDTAETDTDAEIAERIIDGIVEASEYVDSDRTEFDVLDRPVPLDVGQAWVKYARESVNPVATKEQLVEIKEWYAEELRQLNQSFAGDGDGSDMPVPVTARVVENTYRFAAAFARLHLREEIANTDVERAKALVKQLVSQSWNGDSFTPPEVTQHGKKQTVKELIREQDPTLKELKEQVDMDEATVEHHVEQFKRGGRVYQPGGPETRLEWVA